MLHRAGSSGQGPKKHEKQFIVSDFVPVATATGLAFFYNLVIYVVGILLARAMSPADFGDFGAAVGVANVLATFATIGLEKCALKDLPAYRFEKRFGHVRGFWRFSVVAVAVASSILALVSVALYQFSGHAAGGAERHAFFWFALFLPVIAMTLLTIEILATNRGYLPPTLVQRAVFPLVALVLVAVFLTLGPRPMKPIQAVLAVGGAWVVSLAVVVPLTMGSFEIHVRKSKPAYEPDFWVRYSLGFALNSLLTTITTNCGVIILEIFHPNENCVGVYSAVAQTANFLVFLAASTNRLYLPRLARLVAEGDRAGVRALMRERARLLGPLIVVFVAGVLFFGDSILGLFNHGVPHGDSRLVAYPASHPRMYVEGYWALVVLTMGNAVTSFFCLTPTHLQFVGRTSRVMAALGAAAIACALLSIVFGMLPNANEGGLPELGTALGFMIPALAAYGYLVLEERSHPIREP